MTDGETFRDGGWEQDFDATPGTLTVTPVDLSGGTSECHLHIPHKGVGVEIAELLSGMENPPPGLTDAFRRLDENWKRIEEWAAYYIAHCRCRCRSSYVSQQG